MNTAPTFPTTRLRRLRQQPWLRDLVAETHLAPHDLVLPLFVQEEAGCTPIPTMPNVYRYGIDALVEVVRVAQQRGIKAIALFPHTPAAQKDAQGSEALNPNNLVCRAVQAVKTAVPEIGIICDVALDPYTDHGHDGVLNACGEVENDATIAILAQQAVVLAQAGADIVAPSDMMDGRVASIRAALDAHSLTHTLILSYAAKYASRLYAPFRDAVGSAGALKGASKATYQMDMRNAQEALREVAMDIAEGADMVMVKPAGWYGDIITRVRQHCSVPVFAYQVSGEYAMIQAASQVGVVDGPAAMLESVIALKRAGATAILTYAALELAEVIG